MSIDIRTAAEVTATSFGSYFMARARLMKS